MRPIWLSPLLFFVSGPGFSHQMGTRDLASVVHMQSLAKQAIDWQVGEFQTHKIVTTMQTYTSRAEVTSEDGDNVWVKTVEDYGGNVKRDIEALLRRAD